MSWITACRKDHCLVLRLPVFGLDHVTTGKRCIECAWKIWPLIYREKLKKLFLGIQFKFDYILFRMFNQVMIESK